MPAAAFPCRPRGPCGARPPAARRPPRRAAGRADWARIPVRPRDNRPSFRHCALADDDLGDGSVCLVLGTPLAWFLARSEQPGDELGARPAHGSARAANRRSAAWPSSWRGDATGGRAAPAPLGIQIPFTTVAVVLAETFVAMPYYVLAVEGAMRGLDPRLESVARTLGASDLRYLRTVGIPLVLPGIASGLALAWARALGEFGATITFAGQLPGPDTDLAPPRLRRAGARPAGGDLDQHHAPGRQRAGARRAPRRWLR